MKIKLIGLVAIIAASFILPVNISADTKQYDIVSVTAQSGLNIRQTPGTELARVDIVPYSTELQLIGPSNVTNWSKIWYKGKVRYVSSKFIKETGKARISGEIKNTDTLPEKEKQPEKKYLGSYRITYYCNCSACCGQWAGGPTASGVYPEAGVTIATGSQFSYGTKLVINGHTYTVQDRGVGNGCIDIYCASHSEACAGGMYYADVYLVN